MAFAIGIAAWSYLTYLRARSFLHILQLEEYLTREYLHWLSTNTDRYTQTMQSAALMPLAVVMVLTMSTSVAALFVVAWAIIAVETAVRRPKLKAKKPLVMTARARRLLVVGLFLSAAAVALGVGIGLVGGTTSAVALGITVATLVCVFAGHMLVLANLVLYPLEEGTRRKFQAMASRKLQEQGPKVIAITGSAGKTTTKELIGLMLAARFRVLRTPSSFNTPMGISRTVNDSLSGQDYFVCEMGAYRKGEIEKLCRLVGGTDISVITTVNAQHLERFGSLEKTAEAKFEIVEGLKPGGAMVLNFDVPAVREHARRFPNVRLISFGIESPDVALRATNVQEHEGGIAFDVSYEGETVPVRVPLLGRHNTVNVLAALGIGLICGLDLAYMAAALRQAHPPEHRLQPIRLASGGILLDDGYNANPQGIIGALGVLGAYAPKRRFVITPGLIEMGQDKAKYHREIGRAAVPHVDVAVLVGPKQTADIREGMLEAGFPEADIHTVLHLDEARAIVTAMDGWGQDSVVLIANDLPDQFDETLKI